MNRCLKEKSPLIPIFSIFKLKSKSRSFFVRQIMGNKITAFKNLMASINF